jgi:hypothetical protein
LAKYVEKNVASVKDGSNVEGITGDKPEDCDFLPLTRVTCFVVSKIEVSVL